METYISEPTTQAATKKILIFFADVFGPLHLNSQLLQDYFASNGMSFHCGLTRSISFLWKVSLYWDPITSSAIPSRAIITNQGLIAGHGQVKRWYELLKLFLNGLRLWEKNMVSQSTGLIWVLRWEPSQAQIMPSTQPLVRYHSRLSFRQTWSVFCRLLLWRVFCCQLGCYGFSLSRFMSWIDPDCNSHWCKLLVAAAFAHPAFLNEDHFEKLTSMFLLIEF